MERDYLQGILFLTAPQSSLQKEKGCDTFPIELNGFPTKFPNTPLLKDNSHSPECLEICKSDTEMGTLDGQKFSRTASNEEKQRIYGGEMRKLKNWARCFVLQKHNQGKPKLKKFI